MKENLMSLPCSNSSYLQDGAHTSQSGIYHPSKAYLLRFIFSQFWLQLYLGLCIQYFLLLPARNLTPTSYLPFLSVGVTLDFHCLEQALDATFPKSLPIPINLSRSISCASTFLYLFHHQTYIILLLPVCCSPPYYKL